MGDQHQDVVESEAEAVMVSKRRKKREWFLFVHKLVYIRYRLFIDTEFEALMRYLMY